MSMMIKRLIMLSLGALGALMIWPCLSAIQYAQESFPSYLLYLLAQGMVLGAVFGAIFGSFEGIVVSSRRKAFKGLLFGLAFGLLAGSVGVLSGQLFLFSAGSSLFKTTSARLGQGLIFANGAAWVVIGTIVSMTEGLRSKSPKKTLVGLAGGITGGFIGGAALQLLLAAVPDERLALLAGLVILGLGLSFFYSFFESRVSCGTLKLLNGPLKGKEYLLVKSTMSIGTLDSCDIVLSGYPGTEGIHATLSVKKGKVTILSCAPSSPVKVNDEPVTEAVLRREDVMAIGKAKFMYGFFA